MQLKIQRTQRPGGVLGTTVLFCLDVRADYSPAETANIGRYKLGKELIYSSQAARRHIENSRKNFARGQGDNLKDQAAGLSRGMLSLALAKMSLNISIASLGRGHHIECKDLSELLSAEETLMEACRNVKKYLAAASTFSGSITFVDFDDEEKVHMSQGVLEFAALPPPSGGELALLAPPAAFQSRNTIEIVWTDLRRKFDHLRATRPEMAYVALPGGIFVLLFVIFLMLRA